MKQGTGHSSNSGRKVEPTSRAVNPAAVAEIGIHEVRTVPVKMYEGRGFEAPKIDSTIHHSGSQGKHK